MGFFGNGRIIVMKQKLVNLSDYSIKSFNYYWNNRQRFNMSIDELRDAGVTGDTVRVDERLIEPLHKANTQLRTHGLEIRVDEGYRSPDMYQLAYAKRKSYGDGKSTAILNLQKMPHATGLAVDIGLLHTSNGQEVAMRNKKHGLQASFVGFYSNKKDKASQRFQARQKLLQECMESAGFVLGSKNEYWHFEYQPSVKY